MHKSYEWRKYYNYIQKGTTNSTVHEGRLPRKEWQLTYATKNRWIGFNLTEEKGWETLGNSGQWKEQSQSKNHK